MFHPSTKFAATLITAIALSSCVEDETTCACAPTFESTTFSTLSVPETLSIPDTLSGMVFLPSGCTEYQSTNVARNGDTLVLDPIFDVANSGGATCAHGPVSHEVKIPLESSVTFGASWLRYPVGRTEIPDSFVTVPVRFVEVDP